jgi:antitoxin VapB
MSIIIDMALSFKNPEVDRLARELAEQRGVSLTEAVLEALRQQLQRERNPRTIEKSRIGVLREARERLSRLPVRDTRSADEILGYDDRGLPS